MTRSQRIRTALWLLVGGGAIAAVVVLHVIEPDPGDPCVTVADCGPRATCLRISAYRRTALPDENDPVGRAAQQAADDILDPLAPGKTMIRDAPTDDGYCTVTCERDEDCPSSMRCDQAFAFREAQDLRLPAGRIAGQGRAVPVCVRRMP